MFEAARALHALLRGGDERDAFVGALLLAAHLAHMRTIRHVVVAVTRSK